MSTEGLYLAQLSMIIRNLLGKLDWILRKTSCKKHTGCVDHMIQLGLLVNLGPCSELYIVPQGYEVRKYMGF